MKELIKATEGSIWNTISDEQKEEVFLSFEESEDEENLIDNEVVMIKYNKWR